MTEATSPVRGPWTPGPRNRSIVGLAKYAGIPLLVLCAKAFPRKTAAKMMVNIMFGRGICWWNKIDDFKSSFDLM